MTDFRRVADDVRNWGRWGDADELGTLNFITAEKVAAGRRSGQARQGLSAGRRLRLVGTAGRVPVPAEPDARDDRRRRRRETLVEYGPKWLRNPAAGQLSGYFEDNPFRFNDDMIIMPLQAATQWDALSHVYYEDKLYNGFPANSVTSLGAFHCGIDKVDSKGITVRGVLLDLVANTAARKPICELGEPITPDELDEVAARSGRDHRSAATSCWSAPAGGPGSWRPATAPSPVPAWTGRARRGCTTTRSPRWRRTT